MVFKVRRIHGILDCPFKDRFMTQSAEGLFEHLRQSHASHFTVFDFDLEYELPGPRVPPTATVSLPHPTPLSQVTDSQDGGVARNADLRHSEPPPFPNANLDDGRNAHLLASFTPVQASTSPYFPPPSPRQQQPTKARLSNIDDLHSGASFEDRLFERIRVSIPDPPREPRLRFATPSERGSSPPTPCPPGRPLKKAQPGVTRNTTDSVLQTGFAERLRAVEEQTAEHASKAAVEADHDAAREQVRMEQQAASTSTGKGDGDFSEQLRAVEALLMAERASKAAVEAERDAARREQAGAEQQRDLFQKCYLEASRFADETKSLNMELEKRVKITEEQRKEGGALMRRMFELRETMLESEKCDWRNQANFLREQAIRTNYEGLRQKAAEHPELVAKRRELKVQIETLEKRVEFFEEDLLIKQDKIRWLEHRLGGSNEIRNLKAEIESLKTDWTNLRAEKRVIGDAEV
ncbi:hypothetical protein K438DRAFT_2121916 [Mycena galopus ATCC 62051]|nr:hypothetical protein K438DRAFT_2121916 [Mycena galopus ATCC 62051]